MNLLAALTLISTLSLGALCAAPTAEKTPPVLAAQIKIPSYCYFIPPKGWEIVNPQKLTGRVKVQFLGKSNKGFYPSLNLATENVNLTLPEYVKAVKKIHEMDHNTTWRDLGKISTQGGDAQLTQIDTATSSGSVRILQVLLLKDNTVYILTASALKEEFGTYYKEFEKAFKSLTITPDLINNVPQPERREKLKASIAKTTIQNLHTLEKMLGKEFADMGLYWQFLMLQSALQNSSATK
ncbi:MAG TPA: hypothetical protein VIJ46_05565 [Rhabdochlamydiaceae bacterium]